MACTFFFFSVEYKVDIQYIVIVKAFYTYSETKEKVKNLTLIHRKMFLGDNSEAHLLYVTNVGA